MWTITLDSEDWKTPSTAYFLDTGQGYPYGLSDIPSDESEAIVDITRLVFEVDHVVEAQDRFHVKLEEGKWKVVSRSRLRQTDPKEVIYIISRENSRYTMIGIYASAQDALNAVKRDDQEDDDDHPLADLHFADSIVVDQKGYSEYLTDKYSISAVVVGHAFHWRPGKDGNIVDNTVMACYVPLDSIRWSKKDDKA